MNVFFRMIERKVGRLAVVLCLMSVVVPAFAVNNQQVVRTLTPQTFTGKCCFLWGTNVRVHEGATPTAVIVTWTTDYQNTARFFVGLSLNGGPCTFYGSREVPLFLGPAFGSAAYQWIVFPTDGLVPSATNTFELCGGASASTDSITVGFNTLAVQIGN